MAYYGSFGAYPQQQQQQLGGCGQSQFPQQQQQQFPATSSQFAGLASYGGQQPSGYSINQPAYYAGPSYSTTSDNDYVSQQAAAAQQQQQQTAASSAFGNPAAYNGYSTGGGAANNAYNAFYGNGNNNLASFADQFAAYGQQYQQQQLAQQAYVPQPHTSSQTNLIASQSQQQQQQQQQPGDELTQIQPQIEAAYEAATGCRRQPVIKRQVITIPGAPGRVQQIVRRLPTPTPDVVERVFVVKPQRDVVNLIIERPCTPPAQYRDRTIMGKQRKPVINPLIVRVQGRPQCYYPQQQQLQLPQQQQQPICYQSQYVQALPAPPLLNVQSVRVPASSSYLASAALSSSHHHHHNHQHPVQSASQPSLSTHQQHNCGGQLSHQASQSQLQHQLSQPHLAQQQQQQHQANGYVIAPVQFADQQQQQQQFGSFQGSAPFGAGYSTGFPLNQNYFSSGQQQSFPGFGGGAVGSCF
jgi:hypothetical protein